MSLDMAQFGKVAVLMGGLSAEREISLQSGNAVLVALKNKGIDAHGIDVNENIVNELGNGNYQSAFIVLHGRGGEDGTIQGLLELMAMPYTGSGVMASSLAMDKLKTKQIWLAMGLPTPEFCIIDSEQSCDRALETLGLPLIVKPVLEGSSIGMSKVEQKEELIPAWQKAKQCGGTVMAERWIEGNEYTAALLDDQVLPMIKLKTTHKFYDYDAKYEADDTQYVCPCGLPEESEAEFVELVKQAFNAVNASAWGRVDFIVDEKNQPWLIEVNTVPGMTSHSLVPMAAKQAGLSFDDLVMSILTLATGEFARKTDGEC
ncbi:MAG: D-alanine--D-alanine ligase [Gammaproteobacteria bacterium]|nr:D-alanine--D-alanine ligase [Gammaproteobacteria bacterium]